MRSGRARRHGGAAEDVDNGNAGNGDPQNEDEDGDGECEENDGECEDNEANENGFRWLGSGVKVNRLMHYGKCEVDGIEVSVGDNIEIKLGEKSSAVAEVFELFESAGENPHRANIRWYYPFKDIPKAFKKCVDEVNDRELFRPVDGLFLGSEEEIDVETVVDTVTVWELSVDDDIPPGDSYFVRYAFPSNLGKGPAQLIPILSDVECRELQLGDEEEEEEDDEEADEESTDEEVKINYTKLKERPGKKSEVITQDNCNGDDDDDVGGDDGGGDDEGNTMSGKMKKNAQKWKSFSADEVLAELWKTDKDRKGRKPTLKRKLDCTPDKTDSLITVSTNSTKKDNDLEKDQLDKSTLESSLGKSSNGCDTSDNVSKKLDFDDTTKNLSEENPPVDGDNEFSLNVNKKMSPFKSLPKKKEASAVSVFDFDDDNDTCDYSPAAKRKLNKKNEEELTESEEETRNTRPNRKKKKPLNMPNKKKTSTTGKITEKKTPLTNGKGKHVKACISDSVKKQVKTPSEATPGISTRKTPRAPSKSMLELARKRLHVSAVPETLPCRDDEFSQIFSFVQDRLREGTGGCMYISGVPGTGKTATVHEVVRTLRESIEEDSGIPDFKFVEVNGMKLTDPNQAYPEILKALEGKKATSDHAANLLDQRFRAIGKNKENVVLLVDELDLLCTRKQNVMYNIFDWPTHKSSKLVVLAVANTMDLPERVMMNRVSSRLGLTRMTFQPYTFKELEEIVLSRIRGTDAFEDDALQLVARKVAAVSGDARRCLDICRRAVEISENAASKKSGKAGKSQVGMKHVELALKEMFSSPKIIALQCLSEMETMFMKAVISEFRRTGLEEALFLEVYDQFKSHCTLEGGLEAPNMSQGFAICNNLGSCRLLLVEAGNKDIYQRVRLNVNVNDVLFAFKSKVK